MNQKSDAKIRRFGTEYKYLDVFFFRLLRQQPVYHQCLGQPLWCQSAQRREDCRAMEERRLHRHEDLWPLRKSNP